MKQKSGMKPYKGKIRNWCKRQFLNGFCISGIPVGHPDFEDWLHTSKVVYMDDYSNQIETLNSRYDLIGPERTWRDATKSIRPD
jgi:hypothetical protein